MTRKRPSSAAQRRAKPTLTHDESLAIWCAFDDRYPLTVDRDASWKRRVKAEPKPYDADAVPRPNRAVLRARGQHGINGGPRLYLRRARVVSATERGSGPPKANRRRRGGGGNRKR